MARADFEDLIDVEDEIIPVMLDKRPLTWREADAAYKSAIKAGNKALEFLNTAQRNKNVSKSEISNAREALKRSTERTSFLFNECVQAIPTVAKDIPALGERMLYDMVKWPTQKYEKEDRFKQMWAAVVPALGAIRKESAYHAAVMYTELCASDPRDDISKPPVPGLRGS